MNKRQKNISYSRAFGRGGALKLEKDSSCVISAPACFLGPSGRRIMAAGTGARLQCIAMETRTGRTVPVFLRAGSVQNFHPVNAPESLKGGFKIAYSLKFRAEGGITSIRNHVGRWIVLLWVYLLGKGRILAIGIWLADLLQAWEIVVEHLCLNFIHRNLEFVLCLGPELIDILHHLVSAHT